MDLDLELVVYALISASDDDMESCSFGPDGARIAIVAETYVQARNGGIGNVMQRCFYR